MYDRTRWILQQVLLQDRGDGCFRAVYVKFCLDVTAIEEQLPLSQLSSPADAIVLLRFELEVKTASLI